MLQEKLRNWSIRSLLGHCPQVTNKSLRGLIHGSFLLCLVGSNGGHRLVRGSFLFFFFKLNYLENLVKKKKRKEGEREDTKTKKEGKKKKRGITLGIMPSFGLLKFEAHECHTLKTQVYCKELFG